MKLLRFLASFCIISVVSLLSFSVFAAEPTEEHSLTIQYQYEDGSQAFPAYTAQMAEGEEYSVLSPALEDTAPDPEIVEGTMGDEDVSEIVTYATSATAIVKYVFADGSQAAPTFQATVTTNTTSYYTTSPTVSGYTPTEKQTLIWLATGTRTVTYYPNKEVRVFFRDAYNRSISELSDLVYTPSSGKSFSYELPSYPGFSLNPTSISGTKGSEALFYTVTVSRLSYSLTINYVFSDGSEASPTVTKKVSYNSNYSISSPSVDGFFPDIAKVTGTMNAEDDSVTVTYYRESWPLSISYQFEDGSQAAEPFLDYIKPGNDYEISSPKVDGFVPDIPIVSGVMPDNEVSITVIYSAEKTDCLLTIKYQYENGRPAHSNYSKTYKPGESYNVESPSIKGYSADVPAVSGVMPSDDLTVTVTYSPVLHTLTILYQYEDGTEAAPAYSASVGYDRIFSVPSPSVAKHTPDKPIISGTMQDEDISFTVVYSPTKYLLTVQYKQFNGARLADDYTAFHLPGDTYEVSSPSVIGFQTSDTVISGVMPEHNVTETATYFLAGSLSDMGDISGMLDVVSDSGKTMQQYIADVLLVLLAAGLILFAAFWSVRGIIYAINRFTRF